MIGAYESQRAPGIWTFLDITLPVSQQPKITWVWSDTIGMFTISRTAEEWMSGTMWIGDWDKYKTTAQQVPWLTVLIQTGLSRQRVQELYK